MDEYGVNTCVRIAYKAFQMEEYDVSFSLGNISFTKGTIAASGKEKFDQMKIGRKVLFMSINAKRREITLFLQKIITR